jgi:hypothetical protein
MLNDNRLTLVYGHDGDLTVTESKANCVIKVLNPMVALDAIASSNFRYCIYQAGSQQETVIRRYLNRPIFILVLQLSSEIQVYI